MSEHKVVWTKIGGGQPPTNITHIKDVDNALISAGIVGAAGLAVNFGIDIGLFKTLGVHWLQDISLSEHAVYWLKGFVGGEEWLHYKEWFASMSPWQQNFYLARLAALGIIPSALATKVYLASAKIRPMEQHTGGRKLFEGLDGSRELLKRTKRACGLLGRLKGGGKPGLFFHPKFQLNMAQERENMMYIGTSGGGKTVALKPFVFQALARGDKTFLFDLKGEWTEEIQNRIVLEILDEQGKPTGKYLRRVSGKWLSTNKTGSWVVDTRSDSEIQALKTREVKIGNAGGVDKIVLLAPWDERSYAWDIAADCLNEQDAIEISKRFIPSSKDPMWSEAAQQVFRAFLVKLMHEKKNKWGWSDLAALIESPLKDVKDIVAKYMPIALDAISDIESKTTQSIMITMKSFMSNILMLAKAWGDRTVKMTDKDGKVVEKVLKRERVSFRRFILDENYKHRTIVVQGNGRYESMVKGLMQSILSTMRATFAEAPDTPADGRKIWFFLDEFPQLGKIEGFLYFLEVCRSKGLRTVIGLQDYNQLTTLYSQTEADTFLSNIKRWVVVKFPAGPSAQWMSETIGTRRFQKRVYSGTSGQAALNFSEVDGERPVILPSELESKLGKSDKWSGINGLLLGYDDVFIVNFGFTDWVKTQPAIIEAEWWTRIWKDSHDEAGNAVVVNVQPEPATPTETTTSAPPAKPAGSNATSAEKAAMINKKMMQMEEERMDGERRKLEITKKLRPPAQIDNGTSAVLVNRHREMTSEEINAQTIKSLDDSLNESGDGIAEVFKEAAVGEAAHALSAIVPGADTVIHVAEAAAEVFGGNAKPSIVEPVTQIQAAAPQRQGFMLQMPASEDEDESESGEVEH